MAPNEENWSAMADPTNYPPHLPPRLLSLPRRGFKHGDDICIVAEEVTEDQHEVGFRVTPEFYSPQAVEQYIYGVILRAHIVVHKR